MTKLSACYAQIFKIIKLVALSTMDFLSFLLGQRRLD